MDIDYLLLLQKFREATNDILTPFFENLSMFVLAWLFVIPVLIYWCANKKNGLYMLFAFFLSLAGNSVIKLTACVYRPWIREPRIIPAGDAITTSTGYSFPSGHTAMAVPIYGGIALTANKKRKAISAICIILALLTMFSRNYLGVHTPQDVIVGCLIGCLTLAAGQKIFAYIQKHPEKEDPILAAGFAAGWLALIYISVKSYPMDYVNGVLLVDPQKMMRDGYGDLGLFIGFCLSRFIERKYIGFKPCGTNSKGIAIGIAGIIAIQLFRLLLRTPLSNALGIHWGHFVYNFFIAFYVTALYPAVIKYVFSAQKGLSH